MLQGVAGCYNMVRCDVVRCGAAWCGVVQCISVWRSEVFFFCFIVASSYAFPKNGCINLNIYTFMFMF